MVSTAPNLPAFEKGRTLEARDGTNPRLALQIIHSKPRPRHTLHRKLSTDEQFVPHNKQRTDDALHMLSLEALDRLRVRIVNRKRNVSTALQAYAALTTSAARGAVREVKRRSK